METLTQSDYDKFKPIVRKSPKGFIHFLVAGHGGLLPDGSYSIIKPNTKQALVDGKMVYEGVVNRKIKDAILENRSEGMHMVDIVPTVVDMTLRDRVNHINKLYDIYTKDGYMPILWELHTNAFNGKVSGSEIYTTRGNNLSDIISGIWSDEARKYISALKPEWNWRDDYSDDRFPDKEANFTVIKRAKCFGTLIEFFFFDNPNDIESWDFPAGHRAWAQTVLNSIKVLGRMHENLK